MRDIILEACVETLSESILAEKRGANRLELCSDLSNDGLTPSKLLIVEVINKISIPVKVMVRPRAGNFIYNGNEIVSMKQTIDFCKSQGVWGVVFGIMNSDNTINITATGELAAYAKPLNITFHKAIDLANSPCVELKKIVHLPIDAVLTSGGSETALLGILELKKMQMDSDKIQIIAAGRITDNNVDEIHEMLHINEYHGRRIVGDL